MALIRAMATVGGMTGLSRVAGFVRDIMTAFFLGAGPLADAFVVALKLPNFFRHISAEGAFAISFVPLYSEALQKEGAKTAALFAGQAFAAMMLILTLVTVSLMAAMPFVIHVVAPGFSGEDVQYDRAVELARITFPYLLLISLCALMGGMLNAHDKFAPFAAAPIFFNLCQIIAMLLSTRFFETVGHALAWGVTVSGVVQLAWLWWFLHKYKIRLPIVRPRFGGKVAELFRLMGPGMIGAGIIHINLFADVIIASLLPVGAISALYYAERLFQLPLGIVGIAVGTALLPMLSKALAADKGDDARDLFNRALEYSLFFAVPAAVALVLIGDQIITVLFEHGEFTAEHRARVVPTLACLAIGLPAYVGVKILSSAFWSRKDTKTPVKIAAVIALANIVVALILTRFMDVAGIALATGMAGWVQCWFLWRALPDRDSTTGFDARLRLGLLKIALCAGLMGAVLLGVGALLQDYFAEGGKAGQTGALGLLIGAGGGTYLLAAYFTGLLRLHDIRRYVFKRKAKEQ